MKNTIKNLEWFRKSRENESWDFWPDDMYGHDIDAVNWTNNHKLTIENKFIKSNGKDQCSFIRKETNDNRWFPPGRSNSYIIRYYDEIMGDRITVKAEYYLHNVASTHKQIVNITGQELCGLINKWREVNKNYVSLK